MGADAVEFDFANDTAYYKVVKNNIIKQVSFSTSGVLIDELNTDTGIWTNIVAMLFTNCKGFDVFRDTFNEASILKWFVSDTEHYQVAFDNNGINYSKWDGENWTTIWVK